MFMKIPDISPKLFSFSAVAVGYLLIDDMNADEQNALGNWLMLAAQVLCTNAYYRQLSDSRKLNNMSDADTINMLKKMRDAIDKELVNLKRGD